MKPTLITFDAAGGRIKVCLSAGHAQIGAYVLRFWEQDENMKYKPLGEDMKGTFSTSNDDCYDLSTPTRDNDRRRVLASVDIARIDDAIDAHSAKMTFTQDDKVIGATAFESDHFDNDFSASMYLYAELRAK